MQSTHILSVHSLSKILQQPYSKRNSLWTRNTQAVRPFFFTQSFVDNIHIFCKSLQLYTCSVFNYILTYFCFVLKTRCRSYWIKIFAREQLKLLSQLQLNFDSFDLVIIIVTGKVSLQSTVSIIKTKSSSSIILSGYPVSPIHSAMASSLVCPMKHLEELFKYSAGMH